MLRAVLTGLGVFKPTPSSVIHSPFSKNASRMISQAPMLHARPLQMSTVYSARTVAAKNQFGLFGANNTETVKRWLSQHYMKLGIDLKKVKVTKISLQSGDQFVGFSRDKLLNNHVIVYPRDIAGHRIWKSIFNRAKEEGRELGVLELTRPASCFKVSLNRGFWFIMAPHFYFVALHKVRRIEDLEQNTASAGIVRKNK